MAVYNRVVKGRGQSRGKYLRFEWVRGSGRKVSWEASQKRATRMPLYGYSGDGAERMAKEFGGYVVRLKFKGEKQCASCEEWRRPADVNEGSGMCASCEDRHTYCTVCEEWMNQDEPACRHVRYVRDCMYGCGSNEVSDDGHRESVRAVFDVVGLRGVRGMRAKLLAHTFNLQFCGSMLGPADITCYVPDVEPDPTVNPHRLGFDAGRLISDYCYDADDPHEAADPLQIGIRWLNSLQPKSELGPGTVEAHLTTVRWIDEWLRDGADRLRAKSAARLKRAA